MNYSLPYILFLLFILVIAALQLVLTIEDKSRKYINLLVVVAYVLFFGFRGFIGWDWTNYYPYFENIYTKKLQSFEPGFEYYTMAIRYLFKDYQVFTVINTLINVLLFHIFIKRYLKEKYYALGFAIFIAFSGFVLEVDLLRNIKSILLFMISLRYVEEKSFYKFLIINIIGILFHWSSLFLIPLYFFFQKPIPIKLFIAVFIIGNIIIIFNLDFIKPTLSLLGKAIGGTPGERITYYLSNKFVSKSYGLSYGYSARLFTTILVLLYYDKILNYSKFCVIFVNAYFILVVIFLYFSELSLAISRVSILFNFSLCILIPILLEIIISVSTRVTLFLLYSILIIAKMSASTDNILYNYDNALLGKTQSYEDRIKIYKSNYKKLLQ